MTDLAPDELDLLTDLARVCQQAELFEIEFRAGDLGIAAEQAYAWRLVDVAEAILRHARGRGGHLPIAG